MQESVSLKYLANADIFGWNKLGDVDVQGYLT